MPIQFIENKKIFHLKTGNTSYIMQLYNTGHVINVHWGKKVKNLSFKPDAITTPSHYNFTDTDLNPDVLLQEYPEYGRGDFREPAYQVMLENGSTISELRYSSHRIRKGKPELAGLPSTYVESENEAETLEIYMTDPVSGLEAVLSYTIFESFDVITRSAKLINKSDKSMKLLRAMSVSMDFCHSNFEMLQLSGAWGRENHMYRHPLMPGIQAVGSKRGVSSHQHNPFIALLSKDANETYGDVFGFNLVYSGNFLAEVEVDQFSFSRVTMGINPFDFTWLLEPGESFQTPEAVMVYSNQGLGEMSRTYHKLYRKRLCRGKFRDTKRPILVNNWEATYFDFNTDKIESIAKAGKELGIELLVLDDGWFGKRNTDNCSLGDWVVNLNKLPNGLDDLAKRINKIGLSFGLWLEPEMVSPDSDLYRKHPDWCIHVPGYNPKQGKNQRNQLVLDLSRKEVCDEVIRIISDVLKSAPISYVKWDMNRSITDMGSECLHAERQREIAHRYVLGLYRVMDEITSAFPDVLFESCSSGGGRFDPGILYYMPQTWASDDSDAVERLKIQYGTSLTYPAVTIGAHVSASPNHQIGRITGLDIRGHVAMAGTFGYEMDLTKFTDEEKEVVKKQVELFKEIRHITQFGDFYRVISPFESNETAWMFVSEDKKEAVAFYFKVLAQPHTLSRRLKLQGLNPDFNYEVVGVGCNCTAGGDELMNIGLDTKQLHGDFASRMWRLKAVV